MGSVISMHHLNGNAMQMYAVSSADFTYKDKVFIAEASDFRLKGKITHQIYTDSKEYFGISIKSVKTGVIISYYHSDTKVEDGDVLYWEYVPIPEHRRQFPGCRGTKVHILND